MMNELEPHAVWQQLGELYRAMSDAELLRLAAKPDDLTDTARDVLRGEMASRKLQPESDVAGETGPFQKREPELRPAPVKVLARGMVPLMVFNDAIAAREACNHLEEDGMEIDVRDVATAGSGGGSFYGGPPVALQVIVQSSDQLRAEKILREKMGLFPLQEVEGTDEPEDDGTTATLGYFGRREDADEVARALEDAQVWHRIVANPDGTVENDDCYTVEVREIDQERAVEIVEKGMEIPES
jgi:hypothetical protein